MTLEPKTMLGVYEIVEPVGAGGMGEVYRARDTKLGRDVAIKVLPDELAREHERLARFEREAKLLASLNHPAIATLHDFGDGFLVMELVEGETLADRIARGPITFDEARALFLQIAEGLEAAHEKGVIHRDLKPSNIKITPDGQVKILDFGLAKAFAPDADVSAETSQSPTLTKGTAMGTILGTAAYMSPEQAKGKTVDRRADIWAFGCVLFEALTGRRPFRGDDVSETLASVLRDEPDWSALPSSLPRRVRELLDACLQKKARERLRDIGDARRELAKAANERDPTTSATRPRGLTAVPWAVAMAAVLVAVVSLLWPAPPPASPVARLSIPLPPDAPVATDTIRPSVAISPDGQQVVYVGNRDGQWHLFSRRLDESDVQIVPGTEEANNPFFSPDGRWLGFFAGIELKRVSLSGGAPSAIEVVPPVNRGASWGLDDTIHSSWSPNGGLSRVSTGSSETLTEWIKPDPEKDELSYRWPAVVSGKTLLFTIDIGDGFDNARIAAVDLATGAIKVVIDGGSQARYLASGHLVFARGGSLWAAPFDADRLEVLGEPVEVLDDVATEPEGAAHFSVSENGTLAYVSGDLWQVPRRLVWVDRNGAVEPLPAPRRAYLQPSLSPDDRWLTVTVQEGSNTDVWSSEVARGTLTRLTFDTGEDFGAIWSPDGAEVVLSSEISTKATDTGPRLNRLQADGSGDITRLIDTGRDGGVEFAGSFHPDAAVLGFTFWDLGGPREGSGLDIRLLALETVEERPLIETNFNEHSPMFSPDGDWLAYVSDETGRDEVYLRPYPGTGGKRSVSTDGGTEPIWARQGGELFYRSGAKMMAVSVETEPELRVGTPRTLFEGRFAVTHRPDAPRNYDVSHDGQRFLMVQTVDDPAPTRINIIMNWFGELERLAPHSPR